MKHTFAMNAFMKWLPVNSHRFNNTPCNIRRNNKSVTFNLTGITKLLIWSVSEREATLSVYHKIPDDKDDFWDSFISFEVFEMHSSACQYYCDLCEHCRNKEEKRQYYPSKLALWEIHCFENILKWSNEKIISDKFLILNLYKSKGTQALLFSPDEWEAYKKRAKDKHVFKVIPIAKTS